MKRLTQWTALAVVLTLAGGLIDSSDAQRRGERANTRSIQVDENVDGIDDRRALRHGGRGGTIDRALAAQLSKDQHDALRAEIQSLREADASAADISAAIVTQYEAAGVELPEGFSAEVTERITQRQAQAAEREAVRSLIDGLREEGASREEIAAALSEAGYELPSRGKGRRGHRGHRGGDNPTEPAGDSVE